MPAINLEKTGGNIKDYIDRNGYTVKNIQEIFGFATPYAVYKLINGKNLPTADNFVYLAFLFDVRVDDLLVIDFV